jgi:hypothetical protein
MVFADTLRMNGMIGVGRHFDFVECDDLLIIGTIHMVYWTEEVKNQS